MHPNLANHLHTPECNALIAEYKKCVEEVNKEKTENLLKLKFIVF